MVGDGEHIMKKYEMNPIPLEQTHPFLAEVFQDIAQKKFKYHIHELIFDGTNLILLRGKTILKTETYNLFSDIGRNDPCPCGNVNNYGKLLKFKKCCG